MTLMTGMSCGNEILRNASLLLFGQLSAFSFAVASFASSYIADMGLDMPLTQSTAVYLPLAVVYGSILLYRREKLQVPWYCYFAVAVADVQGNYLLTQAYQYTSITSVTLLNGGGILWIMILSWIVLRTRYYLWQLLGAAVCLAGLVLAVLSDTGMSGVGERNPLFGDTLVIAGTLCFAISNVGMEFCAKRNDQVEVLSMLGVFGVLVLVCEISIFERKDLVSVKWTPTLIALYAAYAIAQFLSLTMVVTLIKLSGAALVSLSLLTTSMWAALIRVAFYKEQVNWMYCLAFAFAAIGLIMYSLNDATPTSETTKEDWEATTPYKSLPEENVACRADVFVEIHQAKKHEEFVVKTSL